MKSQITLFLLPLVSLTAPCWATHIYVSGDQTGTWSADSVIVTAEVRVPPGENLTILPGVEVLFQVYCKLIVDSAATLRAVGTRADSIRFDVLSPDSSWHGIRFLSASDSSRLEYCHLTNGWASGSILENCGGAIYCLSSSPTICYNTISGNTATGFYASGGGIFCSSSSPTISGNTISGNSAVGYFAAGGGICCGGGSPIISGNAISENSAYQGGGIAYGAGTISGNTISGNSASEGGGIYCSLSSSTISGNTISLNSAGLGGGICCEESGPTLVGNTISGNSAVNGGGIFCLHSGPIIGGNTISGNHSSQGGGGGVYNALSNPILVNCILWGNTPRQISGGGQVTYSDIQGGYAGTGNINAYPAFVDTAQGDYRLQWGSPCIDSGDPNPIYNDPDGTRADMGAWYYNQSMPVRVLLTPYNAPIQIPPEGGSFQYAIQATNIATSTLTTLLWCNITLPSGAITGPVLGPVRVSLGSGQTISRVRTQNISAHAPAGMYHYNGYAVAEGDTSQDRFVFTKAGSGVWGLVAGDWANTGETLETANVGEEGIYPLSFSLYPSFPNPFNPATVLSYQLPVASHVSLQIYDTAGRLVTTLVDGWRAAGAHQVTFDGSGLPSGIYFAKLIAGDYSQGQKLVLLK